MKRSALTGACWLILAVTSTASAQRAVLDDSLSPRQTYQLDLELSPQEVMGAVQALLNDQSAPIPPLTGRVPDVEIRLDTRSYVGREVRIFLRLPSAMPGADGMGNMDLSWQTSGQFQAGSVSPGQEALLFEGVINEPVTGGVLDFRFSIDSGGGAERFTIEPLYEIEVII